MKEKLKAVSILAELERLGLSHESVSETEIKVLCPFHEDSTPSCNINTEKGVYKCHTAGCGAKGDFLSFLSQCLGVTRRTIWEDLSKRYNLEEVKIIDPSAVEKWHNSIWEAKIFLKELYKRGLTDEMLRKYRIGYDGTRITIPIPNIHNQYVNIRCYLPGAPGAQKMRNKRGHGKIRLFPISQLSYKTIIICGGELKAIATAERVNEYGIGAITATAGEGNWENVFTELFKDKKVYVCFDIDDKGRNAADSICARLKKFAEAVYRIDLPLSVDQYPHGDINDYFGAEKCTADDLIRLLDDIVEWEPQTNYAVDDSMPVVELELADSSKAQYTGKKIKVKGNVAAIDTSPYVIPKTVKVICDRSQEGCSVCPAFLEQPDEDGTVTLHLHPESPAIVEMVATAKELQRDALIAGLKMPLCKVVKFRPIDFYNVEDARLSPQLEITSRAINDILIPAYCIGHGLETNEAYVMSGRMYPHPKTQQSVLLISQTEAATDALSSYVPSEEDYEKLKIFQPAEWTLEGIEKKLDDIYSDLEANVTRIFKRRPLHLIIDLAYHSVLFFEFDSKIIKGWVECLIAGDSSQGKSETILQLIDHYNLGERVECKNATVAGLLGGLQQLGKRWFVTWGIIPKHDKRIVFMEEIKGTSTEVLSKLTDMRSSGVAEIPKIEKRRTHARTRLVMVSNPRSDKTLSMYNFGIEAVQELVGSPEDIRRFDAVLLASAKEIDSSVLNQLQQFRPQIEHLYNKDICHNLILWAWTRTSEQVKFTEDAKNLILEDATRLCNQFTESVPIIDRGSMRYKLCRLSIALACRTFSHDNSKDEVLVRKCHVEYITKFLIDTYSNSIFGYKDFSDALQIRETLVDEAHIKTKLLQTPFPSDLVKQLLYTNEIELRDICDWCGWERGDAGQLLSLLVRKHALTRNQRFYQKTSQFIEFLKELMDSPEMAACDRPNFIQEEF